MKEKTPVFTYADKGKMAQLLPGLFELLHENMSKIAPTGNTYEEDYASWSSCVLPAMEKEQRQIVLMHVGGSFAGYFQYYVTADKERLMMEEIQIKKEFQGSGLFAGFYQWLVKQLPGDIEHVEAYANKKNFKSQAILEHLGLQRVGENKNGNSFFFRGKYADLRKKYI